MNAANPFPSVLSLEKKIRSYFRKSFNEDVVIFCDNCDLTWFKTETVNVVLLGNALRDLQHVVHWPKNSKFKIWVLNHALKRQLTYFYGIDPKVVNVINRYDLYKREEKGIKFPEQDLNFVYSARASRLKNFELILNVLNQLSLSRNQKIPF